MTGSGRKGGALGLLGWLGLAMLATVPVFLALTVIDPRELDGASPWAKPVKFSLSLGVFFLTLAWARRWLPPGATQRIWYRLTVAALTVALAYESAWLWFYAGQARRSHFNDDGIAFLLYNLAGVFAFVLVFDALMVGLGVWRARRLRPDPVAAEGVALGLILTFVLTTAVAFPLAGTGGALGGSPNGPGAGWFGWRVEGSDLRAAHFFATHAMQAVPFAGFALAGILPQRPARLALWSAALAYAGFVAWLAAGAFTGAALPVILRTPF